MADSPSLDLLIAGALTRLSLRDDDETLLFVKELVEEASFANEDRKSAILGMLELDEDDEASSAKIDELLKETSAYQEAVEAKRRAEEEEAKARAKPVEEEKKKVLTPEEEERRKAELLRQYGRIEEETEADRLAREEADRQPDKAFKDVTGLSKKQRKKALDGVDLLAMPNLNKTHVQEKQKAQREASAAAAAAKRDKDKADRKKQLDDAAKKLADKQKRAQKVERKG
ncbi:hypothetical protein JCM8547_007078 [Rhodosporidiobolus lusitaniae]